MDSARKPPRLPALDVERWHGDARRAWSKAFLQYAYALVQQPAYEGMPCTVDKDGKLDWSIPSGRKPGSKNWDGRARPLEWWKARLESLDVPIVGKWPSRTAKLIHPWGWKPCQVCGGWKRISYSYPRKKTVAVLNGWLPAEDQLELADHPEDLDEVLGDLVKRVVRAELRGWLSPGATGNPPDRLDGFHSYNPSDQAVGRGTWV